MILKICGITNAGDAAAAVEGGANALGFNFYRGSPRYILPEAAAAISSPAGIKRVGIFVDEPPARIEEIVRSASLDVAQLHGNEKRENYPGGIPVWKAVRIVRGFDIASLSSYHADALLLDGPMGGEPFDWEIVSGLPLRIILAGGLDASNVGRAVSILRPWGVDACSRIESAPGKKDHKKMNEFLRAARAALAA
jgi:phosphoribosylanthranilate isomerase